jgi:hypothetical protein
MGRTSVVLDTARTVADRPGSDVHKPHASTPGLLSLGRVRSLQPLHVWDPMVDEASEVNAIG